MINPFKKLLNINIRNKLILMFIVVIVPMFAAGVYLILSMIGILRAKVVDEAFTEAENFKTRLRDTIYTTTGAADRIYVNDSINDFLNANFADKNRYLEFYATDSTIKEYLSAYSQIEDIIFYVDIDHFVYNSDFRQITSYVRSSYWYRDVMESNTPRWQVIQNPADNNLYLSYLRQIYDRNGDFIGVMVVSVSNDWIEGLMKDEPNNVMFSVQNGLVFYSNIQGFELGKVFTVSEISPSAGQSGSCEINSRNVLTDLGYTVMNYF
ncbi:MAG: cache domain-containing protein, partial [Oscillospiraceae bacterium]